jgi:hypothetical protein
LATLAAYLAPGDEAVLEDEHVGPLNLDDLPDLVVIQVYITSARRAYRIADHYRARGAFVALGGLHVTSLPDEAAEHADAIFWGRKQTFPVFWTTFARGGPSSAFTAAARRAFRQRIGRSIVCPDSPI